MFLCSSLESRNYLKFEERFADMFNLEQFKEKNPDFSPEVLGQFLHSEIKNEKVKYIISCFLKYDNFKQGVFEGENYRIQKMDEENVVLVHIPQEEESQRPSGKSRCYLKVEELLDLIRPVHSYRFEM